MQGNPDPEILLRNKMTFDRLSPVQRTLVQMRDRGHLWADIAFETGLTREKAREEYKRAVRYAGQVGRQVANLRRKDVSV